MVYITVSHESGLCAKYPKWRRILGFITEVRIPKTTKLSKESVTGQNTSKAEHHLVTSNLHTI